MRSRHLLRSAALSGLVCLGLTLGGCPDDDAGGSDTVAPDSTDDTGGDTVADSVLGDTAVDTARPDTVADSAVDSGGDDTQVDTEVAETTETTETTDTTVVAGDGNSCETAFVLSFPVPFDDALRVTGDTSGATDDYHLEGGCPGVPFVEGDGAPDQVWALTAPSTGQYRLSLVGTGVDLGMYVLSDCADANAPGACLRGSDVIGVDAEGTEVIDVTLTADQTVYVVVDAYVDPDSGAFESGAYSLTVAPPIDPASVTGNVCASAVDVGALPATVTGDLSAGELSANYAGSLCGGGSLAGTITKDEVWAFTASTPGLYDVTLTPDGGDALFYIFDDVACETDCVDFVDASEAGAETTQVQVTTAPQTFYVVVDAYDAAPIGAYTLAIGGACTPDCSAGCGTTDPVCGAPCGCEGVEICDASNACVVGTSTAGNVCEAAITLTDDGNGLFSAAGDISDTQLLSDAYSAAACGETQFTGAGVFDMAFVFTPPAAGDYEVAVTPAAGEELKVYAFGDSACSADCLGHADEGFQGGEVERLVLSGLTAGVPVYLVVDSWSQSQGAGPFTIAVSEVAGPPAGDTCATALALSDDGSGQFQCHGEPQRPRGDGRAGRHRLPRCVRVRRQRLARSGLQLCGADRRGLRGHADARWRHRRPDVLRL